MDASAVRFERGSAALRRQEPTCTRRTRTTATERRRPGSPAACAPPVTRSACPLRPVLGPPKTRGERNPEDTPRVNGAERDRHDDASYRNQSTIGDSCCHVFHPNFSEMLRVASQAVNLGLPWKLLE